MPEFAIRCERPSRPPHRRRPPSPTTTQPTTTVTTTTTTTTTTRPRSPAALIRVALGKERGRRTIVTTLRLDRRFAGRIALLRGKQSLGSKPFGLGAGRHRLKLVLRRGVGPGWTSLRITLRDARGRALTLNRPVRLR